MNETLEHHGILGMKWGVRRYQNKDGTWTKEGKEHRAESNYNNASFSKNEQKQNMKDYADTVSEYWKGVREHKSDLDLLDQVTESSPIIKAVRQTEEYGAYVDSIKAYQDYMKDNFTNNPENQQKAREFVAQKYIDDPVYDEINNYQDAVDYLGESYLNDDLYAVYQHNIDPKAGALYDSMWAKYDKAKAAADKVEEQYIGEMDYDNYKGKIRSRLDRPAGLALLGLTVRRLDESDEAKHSDASSEEDSLMHYGILGMKWGIRRFQKKDGSLTPEGRERYGDDTPDGNKSSSGTSDATPRTAAKSASEMTDQELQSALNRLRMEQQYNELTGAKSSNQYQNQQNFSSPPSNTGALSNAELQAYITRLDMEKRYAQLTAPPPKEVSAGQKFVRDVVGPAVNQVAKAFIVASLSKALGLKGDGDNGGGNNNNNGGKKNNGNDDSQYKAIKKELNDLKSMMGSQKKQDNGGNQKKEASRDRDKESDRASETSSSLPEPKRSTNRDSIFSAARDAARQVREQRREQQRQERAEEQNRRRQESREKREQRNAAWSAFLDGLERQNGGSVNPVTKSYETRMQSYFNSYLDNMGR